MTERQWKMAKTFLTVLLMVENQLMASKLIAIIGWVQFELFCNLTVMILMIRQIKNFKGGILCIIIMVITGYKVFELGGIIGWGKQVELFINFCIMMKLVDWIEQIWEPNATSFIFKLL